jgi:chorismate mutase / prephenate dehydratase
MPDTTAAPTLAQTAEAPPPEDGWRPDLLTLRARLDELDTKIHDLLIDRAQVVESVARSGKTAAFRPGREAAILRRLLARHTGKLPPQTLVRMWRELLAGTTAMQTAVTVAVFDPAADGTFRALAREHFGCLTPAVVYPSAAAALQAVRAGDASVAVLPFPAGSASWWAAVTESGPRLHIIARLPFWGSRRAGVPSADALVLGPAAPDASGSDRSFISGADRALLADAGLILHAMHGEVAEVEGMVADDEPRLPAGAIVLGGYAVPVAGEPA